MANASVFPSAWPTTGAIGPIMSFISFVSAVLVAVGLVSVPLGRAMAVLGAFGVASPWSVSDSMGSMTGGATCARLSPAWLTEAHASLKLVTSTLGGAPAGEGHDASK